MLKRKTTKEEKVLCFGKPKLIIFISIGFLQKLLQHSRGELFLGFYSLSRSIEFQSFIVGFLSMKFHFKHLAYHLVGWKEEGGKNETGREKKALGKWM